MFLRAGIPARTVVWLDELQNFLTVAGVDAARGIRRRVQVPDAFTDDVLQDAYDDPRVQTAIYQAIEGQVTQVLAGGTQLADRVYGAATPDAYSPTARAVILAAADLRRVGHPDPLPTWAIVGAAPGYLDTAQAR